MDPDEVLTGKKKTSHDYDLSNRAVLFLDRPLSKEELDSIETKKFEFPKINPMPVIKLLDRPKRNGKSEHGILIGLKWDF